MNREKIKQMSINTFWCIIGNIILGMGAALAKVAAFGIDPYNGSCMAVSAYFGIAYTTFTLCYNTFLFVFELIFGRKHIGIGTFVNWFLLCFAVDFFDRIFSKLWAGWNSMPFRLLLLVFGVAAVGLGLAIYQECNAGVSPYDSIPIWMCERFPRLKFFWVRIVLDSISVCATFLFGGIVGIGTLITALGLGPVTHLFSIGVRKIRQKVTQL